MKYNYPANYLTKDGKIKKAFLKKAAEFRTISRGIPGRLWELRGGC